MTEKHRIFAICFIVLLVGVVWLSPTTAPMPQTVGLNTQVQYGKGTVTLGTATIKVDMARDAQAWERGMMYRKEWGNIQGMLFVFPDEITRDFWMQHTYLPLDIVFIDSKGKIVSITENAPPLSTDLISSKEPARYVLEIPAGSAKTHDIKPGDVIRWSAK